MKNLKTIPMSTQEIQELFLSQDTHYQIDLLNSKLKGEAFITYIANMQINCSIEKDSLLESRDKLELLKFYFKFRQTVKCDTLLLASAHILLRSRNISFEMDDSWLSVDEMDLFISENQNAITNASCFIDSSLVFVPTFNNNYRDLVFTPSVQNGLIEVIEDPDFIGVNTLGLFTIPEFIEHFIAAGDQELKPMKYYRNQVELIQWSKMPLFQIISSQKGNSFLMSLCHLIFSTEEDDKKLFDQLVVEKITLENDSHI